MIIDFLPHCYKYLMRAVWIMWQKCCLKYVDAADFTLGFYFSNMYLNYVCGLYAIIDFY